MHLNCHSGFRSPPHVARSSRQGDGGRGAQTQFTVDGQLAAHQLAVPICQWEPEPGFVAILAGGLVFGPAEGFE